MLRVKTLADTLTSVRFLLGLYLVWLGLHSGPEGVAIAALTLLTAWVTDVLDGPLARSDARGLHTWIGDHDLEADLTVALGIWVYLALAGFIPFWLAVPYGLIVAAALWHFGSAHLAWGVQALPYGAMIWTAWRIAPPYGLVLVTWIVLVLVVTWPRFPHRILPEFLNGMQNLLGRHS
jgi:phosphatidylglycerophosphate synthase